MNYEVCIIYKEYRWVEIEASTQEEAKHRVHAMIDDGYIGDTQSEDTEIELQLESVYA